MKDRVQIQNPKTKEWKKIDTEKGRILGAKSDGSKWKKVKKVEY